MDVKLVLRAAIFGVDREADRVARQFATCPRIHEASRVPGVLPVIGRIRSQYCRALYPGYAGGRHHQKLCFAVAVLQHHVGCGEIDQLARLRRIEPLLVGHALLANDVPQRVGIGRRAPREQSEQCGGIGATNVAWLFGGQRLLRFHRRQPLHDPSHVQTNRVAGDVHQRRLAQFAQTRLLRLDHSLVLGERGGDLLEELLGRRRLVLAEPVRGRPEIEARSLRLWCQAVIQAERQLAVRGVAVPIAADIGGAGPLQHRRRERWNSKRWQRSMRPWKPTAFT